MGRGEAFLRVLFQALDDDANGVLDHAEFQATDSVDSRVVNCREFC